MDVLESLPDRGLHSSEVDQLDRDFVGFEAVTTEQWPNSERELVVVVAFATESLAVAAYFQPGIGWTVAERVPVEDDPGAAFDDAREAAERVADERF